MTLLTTKSINTILVYHNSTNFEFYIELKHPVDTCGDDVILKSTLWYTVIIKILFNNSEKCESCKQRQNQEGGIKLPDKRETKKVKGLSEAQSQRGEGKDFKARERNYGERGISVWERWRRSKRASRRDESETRR